MKRISVLLLFLLMALIAIPTAAAKEPAAEDLFAGYVQQSFYGDDLFLFSVGEKSAGARLTGNEKLLYDAMVPLIQQIANGERASTVLKLGAASDSDANIKLSSTIWDTYNETIDAVIDALRYDCPYAFYWYDKTTSVRFGMTGSSTKITVTFSFPVSVDYAAEAYLADTAKTGAAAKAVENARAIVEEYKTLDDYQKLLAYKNEICELVDYNHAAVTNNAPYGDPWQMIHVFDGDPTTKVVCEGFAKAFQYLCDVSEFQFDISCYSVVGWMNGERHMWNVVTMNDGKQYLVDVTECDAKVNMFLRGAIDSNGIYLFNGWVQYQYDLVQMPMWEAAGVLELAEQDFVYREADFHQHKWAEPEICWSDDFGACTFSRSCSGQKCQERITETTTAVARTVTDNRLVLTAAVELGGETCMAEKAFGAENGLLTLPKAHSGVLQMVAFYSDGKLNEIVDCSDGTLLDMSKWKGNQVKVFFLDASTHAPDMRNLSIQK